MAESGSSGDERSDDEEERNNVGTEVCPLEIICSYRSQLNLYN